MGRYLGHISPCAVGEQPSRKPPKAAAFQMPCSILHLLGLQPLRNVCCRIREKNPSFLLKNGLVYLSSGIISAFMDSASQPFMKFLLAACGKKPEATLNYKGKP